MANPTRENVLRFQGRSFSIRCDKIHFSEEVGYHVHPEMELAVLRGGGGRRLVNDDEEVFGGLDVVFTPGDLPHCWFFEGEQCGEDGLVYDSSFQFSPVLFTGLAQLYPEFKPMVDFYVSLRQAIQITGDTAGMVSRLFEDILDLSEARQIIRLLEIFNLIYERREFRMIGMPVTADVRCNREKGRLHLVDRIIAENYGRKIGLEEVACAVGMSTTAFCNAFKSMTGTTFNRYLTDYRMRVAGRLLRESALNVSEIGYRVGYADAAHFSRAFTSHFKMPPSAYREYLEPR